jgi:hypothetical protein
MSKLNLVPNEIKGYRIRPDQWNWTVVVVKAHGKESKFAGVEYETPMAYCKNLPFAIEYIMKTVSAIEGRKEQDEVFDTTGVASDLNALQKGFDKALQAALCAVEDLERRVQESGYTLKEIGKAISDGNTPEQNQGLIVSL